MLQTSHNSSVTGAFEGNELLGGDLMFNEIPQNIDVDGSVYEFNEDMLEFLTLLIEEDLRQEKLQKLNKSPPK